MIASDSIAAELRCCHAGFSPPAGSGFFDRL
jgi:hypothetical protein